MKHEIFIRDYDPKDVELLARIFYNTVHNVNIQQYSKEQVDAIAPASRLEVEDWVKKFARTNPIIATIEDQIVGFAEFYPNGYIDCFYCHHEWIRRGVGSTLMNEILKRAKKNNNRYIFADVSITALSFFEKYGFKVIIEQTVVRNNVSLTNFKMQRIV